MGSCGAEGPEGGCLLEGPEVDNGVGKGRRTLKITGVRPNYRKKCFEVLTSKGEFSFPFAKFSFPPSTTDRVRDVYPDRDAGCEAFTFCLESGAEDSAHLDAVLEYHRDPEYMHEIHLYRLTLEAMKAVDESALSKRELIRLLGTSPSQFYRLLDPTYFRKSMSQMISLLYLTGKDVDLVVRERAHQSPGTQAAPQSVA